LETRHVRRTQEEEALVRKRIDKSWLVVDSIENFERDRCVDIFRRPDGSYGFEEFRRDPEDAGAWTPVQYYSHASRTSKEEALRNALGSVAWPREALGNHTPTR
jgi:hypothetical protein